MILSSLEWNTGLTLIKDFKLLIISLSALLIGIAGMFLLYKARNINSNNRFLKHIKDIGYATRCLIYNRKYFITIFSIGIFIWLGSAFQILLIYSAVGKHVPLTFGIAVVPIAILIGTLPITIAGMGTRDLSLVYLFSAYSTNSASISVGILFSFLRYWILALIGIPFLSVLKGERDVATNYAENRKH